MSNPESHTCPTCGHQWRHGHHGGHDCLGNVKAQRDELLEALDVLANGYAGCAWDVGLAPRIKKARAVVAKQKPISEPAICNADGGADCCHKQQDGSCGQSDMECSFQIIKKGSEA